MKERIKELRKTLGMSQEDFGRKLGITKSAVSRMELGRYDITDTLIKLVCTEYSVEFIWLTEGLGNMFARKSENLVDKINKIMNGENEFRKNLFKMFMEFDDSDLEYLEKLIEKFKQIKKAD